MIELDELPAHLNTLSQTDWNKLFMLIPKIEITNKFGEVKGGEQLPDGSMTMLYWSSNEIVDQFYNAVHEINIIPVFNWADWKEGDKYLNDAQLDYGSLDIVTLCKLLTAIIRADRFSDGYLIGMFKNGVILKVIKAIEQKYQQKAF